MAHVERPLSGRGLRLGDAGGRIAAVTLDRDVRFGDRWRANQTPDEPNGQTGPAIGIANAGGTNHGRGLSRKKWWVLKSAVGRFRAVCLSPWRELIAGQSARACWRRNWGRVAATPPPLPGIPVTLAIMSTSGFTPDAREAALRSKTARLSWLHRRKPVVGRYRRARGRGNR